MKKKRIITISCIVLLIILYFVFGALKYYYLSKPENRTRCMQATKTDSKLRCTRTDDEGITKHCYYERC